ncbi:MAG: tetratricopeptide repeat protein [Isosphaerales bacterium]
MRKLRILTLGASMAMLAGPSDVFAGRGGGRGGGYGGGGGQMNRSSAGGSPSMSQPRSSTSQYHPQGSSASGTGARPQSGNTNAGAAAAGAGYANRNQSPAHSNAAAAGAGAGYANRNQQDLAHPNAAAAGAGAGYANRNQGSAYPYAGAAAAGAGYANRNQYDQYHPGMGAGYWNGNYGNAWGMGTGGYGTGVGAWGTGSPMYGWGYSGYNNPYSFGGAGGGQPAALTQANAAPAYDYSQPISTTAAPPAQATTDQSTSVFDQAREAFKTGDYATALQLDQKALAQMPNDATLHEFLALALFAQGNYDAAAAPLYSVLSVGPGWNWTTLIGNYADANTYTEQLRALEAYLKANPNSAQARFVLAYHYITQGHEDAAVTQLKDVVSLQPNDTLSAQLIAHFKPAGAAAPAPAAAAPAEPASPAKLTGTWEAQAPQNAKITLTIKDGGGFTWDTAPPGKPPISIAGTSTLADGVLSLACKDTQAGTLAGQVVWQDDTHFTFRAVGGPADDPGLKFAR